LYRHLTNGGTNQKKSPFFVFNGVSAGAQPKLFLPPPPDISDQGILPPEEFDDFGRHQTSSHSNENSFSNGYGLQPLYRDSDPELRR